MTSSRDGGAEPRRSHGPSTGESTERDDAAVEAPSGADPGLPARVGRFIVLGMLGSGGMGSVLRAYDETLDRQVAVKLLHARMHAQHDRRMLREAQALARLSHPNVVQVYDVGEVGGRLFIAMELVAGQTLAQWQRSPRPWRQCLDAYVQAGRGLAAAHAAGMIHRDFKPSNCIIDEAGRVRVLDFGLARHTEPEPERGEELAPTASPGPASVLDEKLTATGSVLGTIPYMAPEQLGGQEIDARADQYAFCVSLYEALLGERPWLRRRGSPASSAPHPGAGAGASASRRSVPRWLMRVIDRGLANDPVARWPTMDALLDTLERYQRRRVGLVGAGLVVVGVAVPGLWALAGDDAAIPQVPPDPCYEAAQALRQAWDDDQRERVREAILATELAFAQQTWVSVQGQLDGYAAVLDAAHVDACEATMIRHEQTGEDLRLRSACLDEHVGALRQTLSILARADAGVVEHAVTMVAELPAPEPCAELDALRRVAAGTKAAQGSEPLRERLLEARALTTAGKLTEGLAVIEPVAGQAEAMQAPVLLAEARLVEGILQAKLGRHEPAARTLQLAFTGAIEHGADVVAVETLSELVYLVGVDQAKPDVGAWLGSTAEALVGRARVGGQLQARVLTTMGQLSSARGEHGQAAEQLERALELLQRSVGEDHIALAEPLDGLGVALRNQGEHEAALRQYQRALEIRMRWQGPQHPATAHQRINLGVALDEQGEPEKAQQEYRAALEILAASPVPHRELVAHAGTSLAISLAKQGRYGDAARELVAAIEAWESVHGPEHPRVARTRLSLAGVLRADGRHEDAIAQYQRAREILRSTEPTPANDAMVITALEGMVAALEATGRANRAATVQAELERLSAARP